MVGTSGTSKYKNTYYYYACTKHLKKDGCTARNIRADRLEELVCSVTTRIWSSKEAVPALARQAVEAQKKQKESLTVQSLKNQAAEINKKLKNCVQAVESGLISVTITNHIKEYEKLLTGLNEAISREELLSGKSKLTDKHIEFFF